MQRLEAAPNSNRDLMNDLPPNATDKVGQSEQSPTQATGQRGSRSKGVTSAECRKPIATVVALFAAATSEPFRKRLDVLVGAL